MNKLEDPTRAVTKVAQTEGTKLDRKLTNSAMPPANAPKRLSIFRPMQASPVGKVVDWMPTVA